MNEKLLVVVTFPCPDRDDRSLDSPDGHEPRLFPRPQQPQIDLVACDPVLGFQGGKDDPFHEGVGIVSVTDIRLILSPPAFRGGDVVPVASTAALSAVGFLPEGGLRVVSEVVHRQPSPALATAPHSKLHAVPP